MAGFDWLAGQQRAGLPSAVAGAQWSGGNAAFGLGNINQFPYLYADIALREAIARLQAKLQLADMFGSGRLRDTLGATFFQRGLGGLPTTNVSQFGLEGNAGTTPGGMGTFPGTGTFPTWSAAPAPVSQPSPVTPATAISTLAQRLQAAGIPYTMGPAGPVTPNLMGTPYAAAFNQILNDMINQGSWIPAPSPEGGVIWDPITGKATVPGAFNPISGQPMPTIWPR